MAAERAFLSSSSLRPSPPPSAPFPAPFLCARTCKRLSFSHDSLDSRARLLIDHFERHGYHHLQIACLALRLSDFCDGDKDGCGDFTAATSLLGVLDAAVISGNTQRIRRRRRRIENGLTLQASDHDAVQESNVFDPNATSSSPIMPSSAHGTEILSSSRNLELVNRGEKLNGSGEGGSDSGVYDKSFGKEFILQESTNCGPQSFAGEKAAESERPGAVGQSRHNSSFDPTVLAESVSIPVKEPIYEVLEVIAGGTIVTKTISRRQLLKTSGLRLRDIRSVDPSLWVTNSAPALLIRDQAILLKLGSLRAIATCESVLIFDHKSIGAEAFLELLVQRLNPDSNTGVPTMPFELEVVEAALISRTQRLERRLMEIEPRVLALLEVLPNCLTANVLEELRLSKQALVELGSKAGALRQMLLELLESPQEIRRMTIMGRRCSIKKEDGSIECLELEDKLLADDEEEEMEMLLENYLQRCESCHGQAERLLDSAKEMEDSIAVNLSSRRLEVSRLELLLQVGTFCSALGALVAGIFGMNLKSYLEGNAIAFWTTTLGIILGGIVLFFLMYNYLKRRKIL